jgi:hypothetical protein
MGGPTWPPIPQRSERPGEPGALLYPPLLYLAAQLPKFVPAAGA